MATYTLPRESFDLLEEAFGEKRKAEMFARAIESAIEAIDEKAEESIVEKKEHIRIEVKEDLKKELITREIFGEEMKVVDERFKGIQKEILVTREIFDERFKVVDERFKSLGKEMNERFNVVDEKFKSLNFKLNIFIAIALISLTLANPTFIRLIEKIF